MTGTGAGYVLLVVAMLAALGRAYEVGLLLAIAAGAVALLAPTADQRDARRRSQARRLR